MGRFIYNHWRGLYSPHVSLLVILIGLRVLVHLLYGLIPSDLPVAVIVTIILIDAVLLIWQITGTLRSCERSLKGGGDMVLYWGCYSASIFAALSMFSDATTLVSSTFRVDMPFAVRKVELEVHGDTILIDGDIGFRTHTAVQELLENPSMTFTTVRLNSDGGRIYAARAIANTLIAHNIKTEIAGRCASACTLIFLAGTRRQMPVDGTLGFHQYRQDDSVQLLDTSEEQEKDRAYFKSRGVSDAFIARMFQASHQDIWFPDRNALLEAGILTE